jgi:hypothetical protein
LERETRISLLERQLTLLGVVPVTAKDSFEKTDDMILRESQVSPEAYTSMLTSLSSLVLDASAEVLTPSSDVKMRRDFRPSVVSVDDSVSSSVKTPSKVQEEQIEETASEARDNEFTQTVQDLTAVILELMTGAVIAINAEKPFDQPDTDENIQLELHDADNEAPKVRYGLPNKLVEKATTDGKVDPELPEVLLCTYRSFMRGEELLTLLLQRFNHIPTAHKSASANAKMQYAVKLRVCNLLKTWIAHYYEDFGENEQLMLQLHAFIKEVGASATASQFARILQATLSKAERGGPLGSSSGARESIASPQNMSLVPEPCSLPRNVTLDTLTMANVPTLELARQLTLIEYDLYAAIPKREFLDLGWTKDQSTAILKTIRWFNHVSRVVANDILSGETAKARAKSMIRWSEVAIALEKMGNFNGLLEVLSGLANSSVKRLKRSWDSVPSKVKKSVDELNGLVSSDHNFKAMRDSVKGRELPVLPYLGIYLTDLVFLEQSLPTRTAMGLVNFVKLVKVSHVIDRVGIFQQKPFFFREVAVIQDMLRDASSPSDKELYAFSLQQEPRK